MSEAANEFPEPHFDLDEIDDAAARKNLAAFEDFIYTYPHGAAQAVDTSEKGMAEPELMQGIALATSREVGLGFDAATEKAIRVSTLISQLQNKRRENAGNDSISLELAGRLRKERLRIFISRVIDYTSTNESGEIVPLPAPPVQRSRPQTATVDDRAS